MRDRDATEEIAAIVRSISALMVDQRFIGVDFGDLRQVLGRGDRAGAGRRGVAGEGEASGEDRAARAATLAIEAMRRQIAGGG